MMAGERADRALVRILKAQPGDPQPVGAGFLVAERYVLTCAHVVNRAVPRAIDASTQPDEFIYLDFPLIEGHPLGTAKVHDWHPPIRKGQPVMGECEDIAVLELDNTVPGSRPLPLVPEDSTVPLHYEGHAFGFPEGQDNGEWGQGKNAGVQGAGWLQIDAVGAKRPVIRGGYSGAAFLDQVRERVIGMVVGQARPDGARLAFIIPVKTLVKAWPELQDHATFEGLRLPDDLLTKPSASPEASAGGAKAEPENSGGSSHAESEPISEQPTGVTSRPLIMSRSFDVFLSHNSKDKPVVRQLAEALQVRGLRYWLDEEQLVPGRPWQEVLEEIIQTARTAAVLVGQDGLGPWEIPEMRACLSQFVERGLPVIPVLLPDARVKPELPLFLHSFIWVDLRGGLTNEGLDRLEWGITGVKPGQSPGSAENRLRPQPTPQSALTWTLALMLDGDDLAVRDLQSQVVSNVKPLSELKEAADSKDYDALSHFLFAGASGFLNPFTPVADPAPDGRVSRLQLICSQVEAAALPWHCMTYEQQRLGDSGWVIEVLRQGRPSPPQVLDIALDNPLILAPTDRQLSIEARPHARQVREHLLPLLAHRATQIGWVSNRRELDVALEQEPDLIYVYTELLDGNSLILGKDGGQREVLGIGELVERLEALRSRPLLWLHLVTPHGPPLDLGPIYTLTRYCHLVLLQTTPKNTLERSLDHTLDWLRALGVGETEPAAIISRRGTAGAHLWLGDQSVRLRPPAGDPSYQHIRAALIRILLGREEEKRQLRGGVEEAPDGTLVLYAVTGDTQACVHDFPDQVRHYLERMNQNLRVATAYLPFTMRRRDALRDDLEIQLKRDLNVAPGSPPEKALRDIAMQEPARDELLVISLPWSLEPADDFAPEHLERWLLEWREANLGILNEEEIPPNYRLLVGACIEWPEGWLERSGIEAEELQHRADNIIAGDDRGGSVHPLKMRRPLGALEVSHLTAFYRLEHLRDRLGTREFNPDKLARFVYAETRGRFQETVDVIYREFKLGHFHFRKSQGL